MDYKKSSTYHQMWRAVDHIRDWYLGGQRNSFHHIPTLLDLIQKVDPEAVVDWSAMAPNNTFKRAFVCPSTCRHALFHTQPLVCFDACHTKNQKFPTQVFLATCMDGESKNVILCWAVAPTENKENWIWFLENARKSIHTLDACFIPLMSDRQKGLLAAVEQVFPNQWHVVCAQHLKGNVKTNFSKGAAQFFSSYVYANTRKEYEDILSRLRNLVHKGADAEKYIRDIDPKTYARFSFPLPRCGQTTSNSVEQANSAILPIREYAPFKLLVEMWLYMQRKFVTQRDVANECGTMFTERANVRHQENLKTFGQWQVHWDGARQARVQTTDGSQMHLVTMDTYPTCTCRELDEMLWPCEHIMAWDDQYGRDYIAHFHYCWTVFRLRKLYGRTIPYFLENNLDFSSACCPPPVVVTTGRHRVVCIPSGGGHRRLADLGEDEVVDSGGHLLLHYLVDDDSNRLFPLQKGKSSGTDT
ncbi:unnamed protein product [Calypogeia fissa]